MDTKPPLPPTTLYRHIVPHGMSAFWSLVLRLDGEPCEEAEERPRLEAHGVRMLFDESACRLWAFLGDGTVIWWRPIFGNGSTHGDWHSLDDWDGGEPDGLEGFRLWG